MSLILSPDPHDDDFPGPSLAELLAPQVTHRFADEPVFELHPHQQAALDCVREMIAVPPAILYASPPCAGFAPRPLTIDVDARVIEDVPALPAPTPRTSIEFNDVGMFAAARAAENWLRDRAFSYGPSQADGPQAIWHGACEISKWRNLSAAEKRACHATMDGDGREGPMRISLRDGAPPAARAAFAISDADLAANPCAGLAQ